MKKIIGMRLLPLLFGLKLTAAEGKDTVFDGKNGIFENGNSFR